MAELLDALEIETGPRPTAAVVWMHGLGADGSDFAPLARQLDFRETYPLRFVFPHAPFQPVTINGGAVMRAWYDVVPDRGERREDEAGVRASQRRIEALIARERERGCPPARIVLGGFSQGGALALATGLRYPERLAGLVALSTFVPVPDALAGEASPANRDVPIFMAHGVHDLMIPLRRGRRARDLLLELGYRVDWHEYPMDHAVCAAEIADLSAWFRSVLKA